MIGVFISLKSYEKLIRQLVSKLYRKTSLKLDKMCESSVAAETRVRFPVGAFDFRITLSRKGVLGFPRRSSFLGNETPEPFVGNEALDRSGEGIVRAEFRPSVRQFGKNLEFLGQTIRVSDEHCQLPS